MIKKGSDQLFRLRKYLKPYIIPIILVMILLFVQGMAELFLPNLMSDIVNTGIQRGGFDHSSPEAVSEKGMKMLTDFMTEEQRELVGNGYAFVGKDDADYGKYCEKYPLLEKTGGGIYVLKDDADREKLDDAAAKASLTVMLTATGMVQSSGKQSADNSSGEENMKPEMLYVVTDLPMFKSASEKYSEQAQNSDSTLSSQVGTAMAKMFADELGSDTASVRTDYIFRVGLKMILVTLMSVAASIIISFIASKISAGAARTIRYDVFRKVEGFSNNEFDKFSTASLITRTTNDITQIQNLINMGLRMICYAPILGIGGAVLAASTTTSMSWIIIAAIVLLMIIMIVVFVIAMPKFKMIQKLIDRLNLVTRESLSGLLVIRAFGTERHEEERFDKANLDLTGINLFVNRVMAFLMPVMMLIMNGVAMLVVWVGAHQIEKAEMQVGDMMAFIQYSMMIIMSFLMIALMFIIIPRSSVSGARIADVLECEISVKDPEDPEPLHDVKGRICFEDVSFRYSGAQSDVLEHISFTAEPGKTTAIIGTTGSGKSTLINLIPRFYDVTSGRITIDGRDIRNVTQHDLREQIGLVPQKGTLFSGTIDSNLRYGKRDASMEIIGSAANTAQAMKFIEDKPKRFDSPIAQGGTNVSGGQKQRLAIARALVKKAPVYIFDDSFSALDFKTDSALRRALKKYTGDSTVIIVAQRISTIMHADNILVLDEGKIVGKGTHNELLKNCAPYHEIAVSQNSDMETEEVEKV